MDLDSAVTWLDLLVVLGVFLVAEVLWAVWKASQRFNDLVELPDDVAPPSSSLTPPPAETLTPPPGRE